MIDRYERSSPRGICARISAGLGLGVESGRDERLEGPGCWDPPIAVRRTQISFAVTRTHLDFSDRGKQMIFDGVSWLGSPLTPMG